MLGTIAIAGKDTTGRRRERTDAAIVSRDAMALFITFEGLDGSGKSTQLRRATQWLRRHEVPCVVTREPGGTALGRRVRALFLDTALRPADGAVEALLLFASRRQHLLEVIEPALARGEHVLCDRFTDSTLAYQGSARGLDRSWLRALDRLATGGRKPDVTLLFDLPVRRARARTGARATVRRRDRLDSEAAAFQDRVRRGYLELARREPRRFRKIAADRDASHTAREVRDALGPLLGIEP